MSDEGGAIPYWYAFLNPPQGRRAKRTKKGKRILSHDVGESAFKEVNQVLFPEGADSLVVYEWTTDWSDYFAAGHEW